MIIREEEFARFTEIIRNRGIKPLIRQVKAEINNKEVLIYETLDLDEMTEFLIKEEMRC